MSKTLYIVVPCYNEQEVLPETAKRLLEKLQSLVLKNKIAIEIMVSDRTTTCSYKK